MTYRTNSPGTGVAAVLPDPAAACPIVTSPPDTHRGSPDLPVLTDRRKVIDTDKDAAHDTAAFARSSDEDLTGVPTDRYGNPLPDGRVSAYVATGFSTRLRSVLREFVDDERHRIGAIGLDNPRRRTPIIA